MANASGQRAVHVSRDVVRASLLIAAAYIVTSNVSLLLKHPVGSISPLWLPSAIGVAGLLHHGWRVLPAIVAGHVVGAWIGGVPLLASTMAAAAGAVEVIVAFRLLRLRGITTGNLLGGVGPMLGFAVGAALPATLAGAVLGVIGLWAIGTIDGASLALGVGLWLAGDLAGMLLTMPLIALWVGSWTFDTRRRALVPAVLAFAATVAIFFHTDPTREGHQVYGYLIFPFIVWSALRARVPTAMAAHTMVAATAIVATSLGRGPYAATGSITDVWLLQAFVIALVATSLLLKAAMEDRRHGLERMQHQAHHDVLTGLRNRRGMQAVLDTSVAQARADGTKVGVLFVDLDDFRNVNDSVGHGGGDLVLAAVATRLQGVAREGQTFTRPGGDEFIAVASAPDAAAFELLAQRVVEAMLDPVMLGSRAFRLTCSVGIALLPDDAADVDSLLRFADIAMYRAKAQGKNRFLRYTPEMGLLRMERVAIEDGLREALERGEFSLEFQPQVDMATRELVGAEALLRWRHGSLGSVAPEVFVPVAEDIGLVPRLGDWVVQSACRQLRAWSDAGLRPPRLAVNLSPLQLDHDLADRWRRMLVEARLPASLLEAELTESCVMRDELRSARALADLAAIGVGVSLDDFGTGHSSLGLLTKLPLSTVKIDQIFVRDAGHAQGAQVIDAIVSLAHRLGLRCMAEGVETAEQQALLERVGCDAFQGFLVSRPLPPEQFALRYLRRDTPQHAVH